MLHNTRASCIEDAHDNGRWVFPITLYFALKLSHYFYSSGTGNQLAVITIAWHIVICLLSISPAVMASVICLGLLPSTRQPVEKAVPRTSLTVPVRDLDIDLNRIFLAISMISSNGIDFECLIFFSFLRSRGGSLRALITSDDADGTTDTAACRFWMVRRTVTRRPFQSPVALAISSPTFFGDSPKGPIFGARAEDAPTSPPVARRWMTFISLGSILGAGHFISSRFSHDRKDDTHAWLVREVVNLNRCDLVLCYKENRFKCEVKLKLI